MLLADKLNYLVYMIARIVLVMASLIFFGIPALILVIVLWLFLGGVGLTLFLTGLWAEWTWSFYTIGAAILFGGAALLITMYLVAFLCTPVVAFFPTYALHFLGLRYARVAEALNRHPLLVQARGASPITAFQTGVHSGLQISRQHGSHVLDLEARYEVLVPLLAREFLTGRKFITRSHSKKLSMTWKAICVILQPEPGISHCRGSCEPAGHALLPRLCKIPDWNVAGALGERGPQGPVLCRPVVAGDHKGRPYDARRS